MDFDAFKAAFQTKPVQEYPNQVQTHVPNPRLSVHVLTYNHQESIRNALDSVLMQELDVPMEIVVGDDDSTDGTREICQEYAADHPETIRLQLHHRENNRKLDGAPTHLFQFYYNHFQLRGQYVAILSGDDYWTDPQKLQKQVNYLDHHPRCSMVYHPWVARYPADADLSDEELLQRRRAEGEVQHSSQYLTRMFRRDAFTFRREAMDALCEDLFMGCVIRGQGEAHEMNDIRPGVYRRSDQGLWKKSSVARRLKHRAISIALASRALPLSEQPDDLPDLLIGSIENYITLGESVDFGTAARLIIQGMIFSAVTHRDKSLTLRLLTAIGNALRIRLGAAKSSLLRTTTVPFL